MKQTEADEPGSIQYNYQVWRQQRNEQVSTMTATQCEAAGWPFYLNFSSVGLISWII